MNRNSWLLVIVTLLWFALSSFWYVCQIKHQCPDKLTSIFTSLNGAVKPSFKVNDGPISFRYNNAEPIYNESYDSSMNELMSRMGENDTLAIVGEYFEGESGDNLAFNRATEVHKSATLYLADQRIKSLGEFNPYGQPGENDLFSAIRFQIIHFIDPSAISTNFEPPKGATPYRIIIWFRDRTAYKLMTPQAEEAINSLVDTLLSYGDYRVDVVGHTDLSGGNDENYELGRARAWAIKKVLWDKGLEPRKIHTWSKGGLSPLGFSTDKALIDSDQRVEIFAKPIK